MISNFFVLSLRGDTILAKQYQHVAAHDRAQTEALFRKLKFWDDNASTDDDQEEKRNPDRVGDAPPVLAMPDGQTYFHIKRNGLIFGASSVKNVSPNTVLEVSFVFVACQLLSYVMECVAR
jgi:AP-4 complex subunit mu-1